MGNQKKKTFYRYGMRARPFGMGTFPQENENVIGPCPDNNRSESGFYDVLLTAQPLSKKEIEAYELHDLNKLSRDEKLLKIAQKELHIKTLETQNSDRLDFHDIHVSEIRAALQLAYEMGANNGL